MTIRHIRRILRGHLLLRAGIGIALLAWPVLIHIIPVLASVLHFPRGLAWKTGLALLLADLILLYLLRQVERRHWTLDGPAWRRLLFMQILVDELALALLILGGPDNFILIHAFLLHTALTAALLQAPAAFGYALATGSLVSFLGWLEMQGNPARTAEFIRHLTVFLPLLFLLTLLQLYLTRLRRESYRCLEESYTELALLNRQRTQFLLHLTHHIKTPLAVVQTYARMLLDGHYGPIPAEAREPLEKTVYRADGAIRHLISVVRLTNLDAQVFLDERREYFSCGELVPLLVSRLGYRERVRLEFLPDAESCRAWGILDQFLLLLELLLDNAVRYSPAEAPVDLSLRVVEPMLEIRIIDRGIGIAEEHLEHIFDEYFRTREAAQLWPAGAGLSLAICRRIQRLNNCRIGVHSILGEGSTLLVHWPLRRPAPTATRQPVATEPL